MTRATTTRRRRSPRRPPGLPAAADPTTLSIESRNVIYGPLVAPRRGGHRRSHHLGPDDELRFDEGSITLELDAIDDVERQGRTGYVPATPALWTWFQAGAHDPVKVRYPLAAARRLDAAAQRVAETEELRSDLEGLAQWSCV